MTKKPSVQRITDREEFAKFARALGVRPDWHEPDEQHVYARVAGNSFDNAGFWPTEDRPFAAPELIEQHVIFAQRGEVVACVNLATLCGWASRSLHPFSALSGEDEANWREQASLEIERAGNALCSGIESSGLRHALGEIINEIAESIKTGRHAHS